MDKDIKYNLSEKVVIYGLATVVGLLVSILSLLLFSALCLYLDMQENYSFFISGICLALGGFISGMLSSKKLKLGGILNGLICGVVICAIVVIISLFLSENEFTQNSLYRFLLTVVSSMIGGIIGVNTSTKRKII